MRDPVPQPPPNQRDACSPYAASSGGSFGHRHPGGNGRRLGHHGRAPGRRKSSHRASWQRHSPNRAILVVLITILGPISGAHFNPAVSIAFALRREIPWPETSLLTSRCRLSAALSASWLAHAMFELPLWQVSATVRTGPGQWLAEFVATFGLLLTILGCVARTPAAIPYAVGLYITVGLLVHVVNVIRQSGRDHRAFAFRHFRGYRSRRRHCIYRRAAPWHAGGGAVSQLVLDQNEKHGRMTALPDRRVVIPAERPPHRICEEGPEVPPECKQCLRSTISCMPGISRSSLIGTWCRAAASARTIANVAPTLPRSARNARLIEEHHRGRCATSAYLRNYVS